jgi:hypothetical protein
MLYYAKEKAKNEDPFLIKRVFFGKIWVVLGGLVVFSLDT